MYTPIVQKTGKHYGSNFWDCFSHKVNRDVYFYNELEYEHWIHVETNSRIIDFCENPFIENESYDVTFDMWIKWQDGKEEFIEVAYNKEECLYKMTPKKQKQIDWCQKNNYAYRIVQESEIRTQPLLKNLKMILPYIKDFNNVSELHLYKILKYINQTPQTVEELINQIEPMDNHNFYKTLFYLYHSNQIKLDINENIFNFNSKVCIGK